MRKKLEMLRKSRNTLMYQNKFSSQIEEAIQDLIMKMEEKFIQQD